MADVDALTYRSGPLLDKILSTKTILIDIYQLKNPKAYVESNFIDIKISKIQDIQDRSPLPFLKNRSVCLWARSPRPHILLIIGWWSSLPRA